MGNNIDRQYKELLEHILHFGVEKKDRTGTGTKSIFGWQIRHNMKEGFPLLTTKKMFFKGIVTELLWFLRGDTNIKYLVDNDCHIWDGDAYENFWVEWYEENPPYSEPIDGVLHEDGVLSKEEFVDKIKTDSEFAEKWGELGPIYGKQWRSWGSHKQKTQIGWLTKIEGKWFVKWSDLHSFSQGDIWSETLIQECDQSKYTDGDDGKKVNFENVILGFNGKTFGPNIVAKIVDYKSSLKGGIDQIANLISELKTNPDSRRLMVNAWNVGELDQMVLPPCHYGFQVWTRELSLKERYSIKQKKVVADLCTPNCYTPEEYDKFGVPRRAISLMWNQRSVDTFLGLPFNIASYALLLEIIAKEVNMVPDELIGNLGDTHLYLNHIEQAKEQITRTPFELPTLGINTEFWLTESGECGVGPLKTNLTGLEISDFEIENYQSHPAIKAPLSN